MGAQEKGSVWHTDGSISGLWWALGVLGVAALASFGTLAIGRRRPASEQQAELRRAA